MQAVRGVALRNQFCHAWLDHRTPARLHCFDFRWTEVDADYVMALAREAGCRDRAHVPQTEYADGWNHRKSLFFQLVFKHAGATYGATADAHR